MKFAENIINPNEANNSFESMRAAVKRKGDMSEWIEQRTLLVGGELELQIKFIQFII